MYVVTKYGVYEEFATPDAAFRRAKELSHLSTVTIKKGKGIDARIKAFARDGQLYDARACNGCGGTGKSVFGACYGCQGDGYFCGEVVP